MLISVGMGTLLGVQLLLVAKNTVHLATISRREPILLILLKKQSLTV